VQCRSDADCRRLGGDSAITCSDQGHCVDRASPQMNPGNPAAGPPGCYQGTPGNDTDFFNQCTRSQSLKFDNCQRLHLCDDTALRTIDPPPPTTGPPPDTTPPVAPSMGC